MVTPVPIGFGDWSLSVIPDIPQAMKERTLEIFAAFEVATNPALRQPCRDAMIQDSRAVVLKTNRKEF
jgi:hypothetical protein